MKYKYTLLKNRLYYDERLVPYLNKMSKKGWNLVSIQSLFKFEKSTQVYKYQVDYNPLSDEYLETLNYLGYEHVCCKNEMQVYRNLDLKAEDLSSDEDILCDAKLSLFKPWMIVLCLVGAVLSFALTRIFSIFYRKTWGSLLLNLDLYFISFLFYSLTALFLIGALGLFLKRRALKKRDYSYLKFKYLDGFIRIFGDGLTFVTLIMVVILKMATISFFLKFLGFFVLALIFGRIVSTKIPLIKNESFKKIAMIVAFGLFIGIYTFYGNLDLSSFDKQDLTITLPKEKELDEQDDNLLLKQTHFSTKIGYDSSFDESLYSDEGYYQCLNTFISNHIFKELVVSLERESRMPSDNEIDQITEEKGSWSSEEVEYRDYKEVIKNLKKVNSHSFDKVYQIGKYQVGLKEKEVLVVYDNNVDDFYSHYINLTQK